MYDPQGDGVGIGVTTIDSLSSNEMEKLLVEFTEKLPSGKEVIKEARKNGWQLYVAESALRVVLDEMNRRRVKPEFENPKDKLDSTPDKSDANLLKDILERMDTIKDNNPEKYRELLERLINTHVKG